jgi:hypothetical protein
VKKLRLRHLRGQDPFDILLRGFRAIPFLPPDEAQLGAVELVRRITPFHNLQDEVTKKKIQSKPLAGSLTH